jgi:hypothetical protein
MPQLDFYNANLGRAYPFVESVTSWGFQGISLGESVIVDAGFQLGVGVPYLATDKAILSSIEVTAENVLFTFSVGSCVFVFTVPHSAEFGSVFTAQATGGPEEGTGFLVIGYVGGLSMEPVAVYTADAEYALEPTLVLAQYRHWVSAFNLASQLPAPWSAEAFCDTAGYSEPAYYAVTARALTGELVVKPGYNAAVRQRVDDNSLEIGVAVGLGDGTPCGELAVPVDPAEFVAPTGGQLTGVSCAEIIQNINGVSPNEQGEFTLVGRNGVSVTAVPAEHKLIIAFKGGANAQFCQTP